MRKIHWGAVALALFMVLMGGFVTVLSVLALMPLVAAAARALMDWGLPVLGLMCGVFFAFMGCYGLSYETGVRFNITRGEIPHE